MKSIQIGTSGWHYEHWKGPFYPESLPRNNFLDYYAERFSTLEINTSFYQMPQEKTLIQWRNGVPDSFLFSMKASRYITHIKKLKDARQILSPFFKRVELLNDKLGPILFQLPPQWRFNLERLSSFLKALPQEYRYAFEFRDSSWFNQKTYDTLAQHNAAFGIYQVASRTSPLEITADFAYVRLLGSKAPNQGKYSDSVLQAWARQLKAWGAAGKDIYCYFDNDESGFAVSDAIRMKELLDITVPVEIIDSVARKDAPAVVRSR